MELIATAIAALLAGLAGGFFLLKSFATKANQGKIEEMNQKADLIIKEARLTAQRTEDEAKFKSQKLISRAESKNESIKQKKIQEAKDRFAKLKSDFAKDKSQHKISMKEMEMESKNLKKDIESQETKLKEKLDAFAQRKQEIEHQEAEVKTVRTNLDKQIKIVAKKKEELDAANEERIKALENIAKLSQSEAKEQLLEAVKAKAETDAMALVKDTVMLAKGYCYVGKS